MSYSKELQESITREKKKNKKNNQLNEQSLIEYSEDKFNAEYVMQLKQSYEEMGELNLLLSECNSSRDLQEIIEYEAWLSESDMSDDDDVS
ncbi:hypothetical protein ACPWSR_02510 [Alloiococcus sp. CFN-8]|uniref:hypothetical protein n=1 Tax=Alloiococcus sp. CFN-8 TaxID=3416081 RepID=UPI003CEEEC1E